MVPFAGWEMPIQYKSILAEHQAVREKVGLFDVSHMGFIAVRGPDAEALLDYLSTNQIAGKKSGTATYTVWANEKGGSVDDLIVYKNSDEDFFVIANAGNRQKDLDHLKKYAEGKNVEIQDRFEDFGILALQGPNALPLLSTLYPEVEKIKPMHFIQKDNFYISRTGYTGAGGFEIYAPNDKIVQLWDLLLQKGVAYGIEPTGLGARDTLRLEMGYALYGHELTDTIAPNESVADWTIKWDKPNFLGKKELEELKRHPYAVQLLEKGIARQGFPVLSNDQKIGEVTSGTFSPTLNQAIALILVDRSLKIGDIVNIQIRNTTCQAQVVELPFVRRST
jgi:aminomethyltransferase